MSITYQERSRKLRYVAEHFICHDPLTLLMYFMHKDIVPGVCTNPDCNLIANVEQKEEAAHCPNCETNTVQSVYVLAGVV